MTILRPSQKLLRFHWLSIFIMAGLITIGIMAIYSATHLSERPELYQAANQQMVWLGIGLIAFFAFALLDYQVLIDYGAWILAGACFILVLVLIPGIGREINNARSWIRVGPVGIQPAEFAKIAYVCGLAWLLVSQRDRIKKLSTLFIVCGLACIPMFLILGQPDLGSALVFGPVTLAMLFIAGARKRFLALPVICIVAGIFFAYFVVHRAEWTGTVSDLPDGIRRGILISVGITPETPAPVALPADAPTQPVRIEKQKYILKPYQLARIRTFFNPNLDPQGSGYNIRQSLITIGSGGLNGKGWLQGDQTKYGYLPKNIAYNDFIFCVIGEEFGFIGGSLLVLGEVGLLICMIQIASRAKDYSGSLLAAGFIGMFLTHVFINIGMTINVVPITGIPLPLVSYGGTFLVTCLTALGILQSIWIHRKDY
jgi:rod shape determining protein RodA